MDLSRKQEQRRQNTEGALLSPVRISHISPERLKGSLKGRLSDRELKHLAVCPWCREALSEAAAGKELLTAPRDLKSSILERSRKLDVQIIAGSNQLSKKLQFFYFSLKVGAAVLCSLSLLFLAPNLAESSARRAADELTGDHYGQLSEQHWEYYKHIEQLTGQLHQLSNFNLEVFRYDKKER